jgi:hypothetical protein
LWKPRQDYRGAFALCVSLDDSSSKKIGEDVLQAPAQNWSKDGPQRSVNAFQFFDSNKYLHAASVRRTSHRALISKHIDARLIVVARDYVEMRATIFC